MFNVKSKKNSLKSQIRSLGQADQPVAETDLSVVSNTQLDNVLGGFGGDVALAAGRTATCGERESLA
jgi:hypothetical protein